MSKKPLIVIATGTVERRFRLPMGRKGYVYAKIGALCDIVKEYEDSYAILWMSKPIVVDKACITRILEVKTPVFDNEKLDEQIKKVEDTGMRFNKDKLKWSLVDYPSMEGMVRVLQFGAVKYAPYNWQKGMPFTELLESMQRHLSALMAGEDIDPESGEFHEDHIHCNAMFLSWMRKYRSDLNDRNKYITIDSAAMAERYTK